MHVRVAIFVRQFDEKGMSSTASDRQFDGIKIY